ncbi:MAG: hypothetical protein GY754_13200 [bacterium]|nr:hypothetical protein [bacterium]
MAGKKGQKWATDREPPKMLVSGRVPEHIKEWVADFGDDHGWKESSAVNFLLHFCKDMEKEFENWWSEKRSAGRAGEK